MRALAVAKLSLLLVLSCTKRDGSASDAAGLVAVRTAAAAGAATGAPKAELAPVAGPRFVGRFVASAEGARFAWSGSAIVARFEGSTLAVRLRDEGDNVFAVELDGAAQKPLRTSRATERYVLAEGLAEGPHTVTLTKRTEARVGEVVFAGFEGKLLAPPPPSPRRIELVGDSITTGYGNEGPGPKCPFVPWQQNETLTYGALAARALGAEHTTIAWSGKTLHEMRGYFDKALPARADSRWDFARFEPQVVVLNVGTNNFALRDPGEAKFVRLYHELFATVRAAYPRAFVFAALGPMLTDVYPEGHKNLTLARKYMKVAVERLREAGESNVELVEFREQSHGNGLGCGFHPSLETHALMSEQLTARIKERMGW